MQLIRLDKYLADAGIGTRSQIKNYIRKGFVTINDSSSVKPETKIDPSVDIVTFHNEVISLSKYEYYIMNKPAGYVCAAKDNLNPTVLSLIENSRKDMFTVGRLDKDTEGLLLITNDGALSHKLLSPKHHVAKTYYAILDKPATTDMIDEFAKGLYIGDEDLDTALPAILEILNEPIDPTWPDAIKLSNLNPIIVENHTNDEPGNEVTNDNASLGFALLTISEGKYHQVKRMFKKKGIKVLYLKRTQFGPLSLNDTLPCGSYRELYKEEIEILKTL